MNTPTHQPRCTYALAQFKPRCKPLAVEASTHQPEQFQAGD